jgi:hypothetical protein
MRRGQPLGLDELMIVNPSPLGTRAVFLGADGRLCQVRDPEKVPGLGQFFLGEDGTLYQVQGPGLGGLAEHEGREPGRFFLGEDGTLYQVVT